MSFVNTRAILGDQVTLDALIAHTLTELNEDGISDLVPYAVSYQDNLVSVNFPNVSNISNNGIANNPLLETVDIGKQCTIATNAFRSCPNIRRLILRGTTGISSIGSNTTLADTKIVVKMGAIYVPRALISAYRADQSWNTTGYTKMIKAIEDMDISSTDFSSITHTWTQIKSMVDDDSFFASSYAEGDFKQFTYGQHTVVAEIAKINSANKYVDFVLVSSDENVTWMSPSTTGMVAYSNTTAKARLDEIYANELPSDLKAAITPVSKKYYVYDGTTETVTAPLWFLNTKDVNASSSYLKESEGEEYSIFSDNSKRKKYDQANLGQSFTWVLGSAYNSSTFVRINTSGACSSVNYLNSAPIIFGFRIQKSA